MDSFDLVIIGAGIHGLALLKTYREVNPGSSILVLDKDASLGGVWSKQRLYSGLHTNNHFRTFEFSEFPMSTEGFDPANDHIPGKNVNQYLQTYAKRFDLIKHMRFSCSVVSATDEGDDGWTLVVDAPGGTTSIKTSKLIVATGLTAEPFMPKLRGKGNFGAPIYHSSEFARANNGLGPYRKVVLLSGGKFSWDIACAYASVGVQVDWIISKSGHGPCWMAPNRLTPLKIIPELLIQTRLISWLSPCIWGEADGFTSVRRFLHQHPLGRKIVDGFFAKMEHGILEANDFDSHPETAKLKPWDDLFYVGTNRGLLNYDCDFFDLVRSGKIRVHIADITQLSDHTVHLSNGQRLDADVLICGTGWKDTPPINFITKRELGLPGFTAGSTSAFIPQADEEILRKCPKLQRQPESKLVKPLSDKVTEIAPEPYRLHRFMVPPAFVESRSLAFAGAYRSPATVFIAQAQALWITAFMGGHIPSLADVHIPLEHPNSSAQSEGKTPESEASNLNESSKRVLYETALHTQFGKWRYSNGFGARFPDFWFDCLPYVDLLLRDVGVNHRRKTNLFRECFTPYWPQDYAGIVPEFLKLTRMRSQAGVGIETEHSKNTTSVSRSRYPWVLLALVLSCLFIFLCA